MTARRLIVFISICFLFTACSTTRTLPEGESLYTGATVKLNADNLTVREKKVFTEDLERTTRPKPNSKFLGIPFKLLIWNMFGKRKPESFLGKLRSKFGEPPVLASQVNLGTNSTILQNHLENKGFFNAKVKGDTTSRRRKVTAHYTADAGNRYKIDSISYVNDSSAVALAIIKNRDKSLLISGNPYDLDVIRGERDRIDAYLKEVGYYYFSPDFLIIQVDSTGGNNTVDIRVRVKADAPEVARVPYAINDVYIYSDYSLNTASIDTVKSHAEFYKGYYVIDEKKKYNPKLFEQALTFNPGELYNRTDHNKTLNRLMNLNVFKFVKNRFERADVDSPKLNAYYYLTPFPQKSIRAELGANTKSNNLNGQMVSFGYHHRNKFRGGEQFDFRIYGGTEASFGGTYQGFSTFRAGSEINFAIPRFVIPFYNMKRTRSGFIPRTNFQLAYEILNRHKLYNINSFRGAAGYIWKESVVKSHELYPISITYILPGSITPLYRSDLAQNPSLRHVTDTQFILGSTYQYNMNQQAAGIQKVNSFFFNGLVDMSGNLAGLFVGAKGSSEKRLFDLAFAQYFKFEADGRYYRKIGLGSTWANRIVFGYGLPYGNSFQLPYVKQFFTGGNSSVRAFRSRTIGPGKYRATATQGGYIPDQTGDIKVEMNTEFRPQISGPLYGALFVDAGNVWLKNEDPNKPGSKFTKDFLKELAVGTGAGIRLDIQIFVIRFDVAFPIRKPWLAQGQQWVLNQVNFGNTAWRRENVIYNLAIGYPF